MEEKITGAIVQVKDVLALPQYESIQQDCMGILQKVETWLNQGDIPYRESLDLIRRAERVFYGSVKVWYDLFGRDIKMVVYAESEALHRYNAILAMTFLAHSVQLVLDAVINYNDDPDGERWCMYVQWTLDYLEYARPK